MTARKGCCLWVYNSACGSSLSSPGQYRFTEHTQNNFIGTIKTKGFPNSPYEPETFTQWQIRADAGHVVKLKFDTFNLEEDCKKDFVKIYDSLVAMENNVMDE